MSTQYACRMPQRRAQVLAARGADGKPVLNGIDYLEVTSSDQKTLSVHFLFPLPGSTGAVPPSPATALSRDNIVIQGGVPLLQQGFLSIVQLPGDLRFFGAADAVMP